MKGGGMKQEGGECDVCNVSCGTSFFILLIFAVPVLPDARERRIGQVQAWSLCLLEEVLGLMASLGSFYRAKFECRQSTATDGT